MQEPGPFEPVLQTDSSLSRDRTATVIVVVGILLGLFMLVLVLPPISILDNGGSDSAPSGPVAAVARDEMPPAPAGFEPVSALYDLTSTEPVNRAATVGVELTSEQSSDEQLFLYTYQGEEWQQVATAVVVADGHAASGEVNPLPGNVAVFRRNSESPRSVIGTLPANADLDEAALGGLTTLNPQGYTANEDGSISGSLSNLPDDLNAALVPSVGATDAGSLSNLLSSEAARFAHTDEVVALVVDNNYAGVDLDYRVMDSGDGADFVALLTGLSDQLHQNDKTLTLTLPAPIQRGTDWDTRGFDWDAIAPLADAMKIVPDGDPGTYYVTLSDALAYLVPRVGASKLYLTVDSLSRETTSEGVRSFSLTEALTIASTPSFAGEQHMAPGASIELRAQNQSDQSGAANMHWDGTARAVAFSYVGGGGQRTVWLANQFSEAAKLELAEQYQLRGVAVSDVSTGAGDSNVMIVVRDFASGADVAPLQPNGELLQPTWAASSGALEPSTGASVTWQAPDSAGEYTITLIVSDGTRRVGQELQLSVGP